MHPPINDATLKGNPDFANLYQSLTGSILNPDGSTKNDAGAKKRDAIRELKFHRLRATKQYLLKNALATMSPPSSQPSKPKRRINSGLSKLSQQETDQLPPETIELLLLLPTFLGNAQTTRKHSLELLLSTPPFSNFPYLLPQLTSLVSSHLIAQASALARVLHPNTNPSFIHRSIPQLYPTVSSLLASLSASRASLSQVRLSVISALVKHLNQHTEALVLLLRILETKHVLSAMSSELRATSSMLSIRMWVASLQLLFCSIQGIVYPPETRTALANYRHHLGAAKMRIGDSIRTREAELGDYGVFIASEDGVGVTGLGIGKGNHTKEKKMREMARIWREMEGRLGEIRRDLERLDRS